MNLAAVEAAKEAIFQGLMSVKLGVENQGVSPVLMHAGNRTILKVADDPTYQSMSDVIRFQHHFVKEDFARDFVSKWTDTENRNLH